MYEEIAHGDAIPKPKPKTLNTKLTNPPPTPLSLEHAGDLRSGHGWSRHA